MVKPAGKPRTHPALDYRGDQLFFVWMSVGLATFILLSFAQWSARGYVDPLTAPVWLHVHGLLMVAWLGLLALQNYLALRGRLHLHRTLGWTSLGLLLGIAISGILTGWWAIELHRVPPFWSNADMLALATVQVSTFVIMVIAAIGLRRRTEWHRRLMIGATIILMKAALDRLLPLPLMGIWGPVAEAGVQLVAVAVLARHDRARLGEIHPATLWIAGAVVATHVAMWLLANNASFAGFADNIEF